MEMMNFLVQVGKKVGIINPFPPHSSDFGDAALKEKIKNQGPLPPDLGLGSDLGEALSQRLKRKVTFSNETDEVAFKLGEAAMRRRVRREQSLDIKLDE